MCNRGCSPHLQRLSQRQRHRVLAEAHGFELGVDLTHRVQVAYHHSLLDAVHSPLEVHLVRVRVGVGVRARVRARIRLGLGLGLGLGLHSPLSLSRCTSSTTRLCYYYYHYILLHTTSTPSTTRLCYHYYYYYYYILATHLLDHPALGPLRLHLLLERRG